MRKENNNQYNPDLRFSCPFYETDLKLIWKKERNRLAAKKSRDKKAVLLKSLESREKMLENRLNDLHEAVIDYDNILDKILYYFEVNIHNCDMIMLFSIFCNLRKPNGMGYFHEIENVCVTNDRVEEFVKKLRISLNDMVIKYNNQL